MTQHEKNKAWKQIQDELADESGLAVVLVEGEDSAEICISNNNSMCDILYNSAEFAPRCAEYCGKAFQTAHAAGKAVHVKCHADLNFLTVPVETKNKKFAAIIGRAFLKSEDYRTATERAMAGDWQQFPAEEFFENALISGSISELEKASKRFEKLTASENELLNADFANEAEKIEAQRRGEAEKKDAENRAAAAKQNLSTEEKENRPQISGDENGAEKTDRAARSESEISEFKSQNDVQAARFESQTENRFPDRIKDAEEASSWRSFFGGLLDLEYKTACLSMLDFVSRRFGAENLAWLERRDDHLKAILATGEFDAQSIQIKLSAQDERLMQALRRETALELRERKNEPNAEADQIAWLFPAAVGGEIRAGLIVAGSGVPDSVETKRQISRFVRQIAPQIEILRLREELKKQSLLSGAVLRFNESLQKVETEDFWTHLAQFCADLMRAERGSLLFFDEETQNFVVKAATGRRADVIRNETDDALLGKKVSQIVLQSGTPLVIPDINETVIPSAPADWKYRTDSFISYPITVSEQKIGVLNMTDKSGGGIYDDFDLELLNSIAPQLAVALDRAALKRKAGEYEQLSVTDGLTGLYNRRYLEARLSEEIKRSHRNGSPMSFLMIDIDKFKPYNDQFGHAEGDKALQLTAQSLKATLRGADVAARYGGEEFSILLPQTTLREALLIAERVRQKVEETEFPNRKVTVSIGVSSCSPECTTTGLMSEADQALYAAKRRGGNNVQVFGDLKLDKSNDE